MVVDQFAEARERDVLNLAEELDYDMKTDRNLGETRRTRLAPVLQTSNSGFLDVDCQSGTQEPIEEDV